MERGGGGGRARRPAGSWSAPPGSSEDVPAALPCGPLDFACGSGECAPRGWRCDGEEDCADGSDESGCDRPCAPHHVPCARGSHCVAAEQLCDGVPHCPDGSDEDPGACGESPGATRAGGRIALSSHPNPGAPARESDLGLRHPSLERVLCSLNLFWETLKTSARPPSLGRVEESRKGFLSLIKRRPSGCAAGGGPVCGGSPQPLPTKTGGSFCVRASQIFTVLTTCGGWGGLGGGGVVARSIGSICCPPHGLPSCTLPKVSLSQAGSPVVFISYLAPSRVPL